MRAMAVLAAALLFASGTAVAWVFVQVASTAPAWILLLSPLLALWAWLFLLSGRAALAGSDLARVERTGLTVVLDGRAHRCSWREIARFDSHPFSWLAAGRPGVIVDLHTPSGAPVTWLVVPDRYTIRPGDLAARLTRWRDVMRDGRGGHATAGPVAASEIRRQERDWLILAAISAALPFLLGLLVWLRSLPRGHG